MYSFIQIFIKYVLKWKSENSEYFVTFRNVGRGTQQGEGRQEVRHPRGVEGVPGRGEDGGRSVHDQAAHHQL